MEAMGAKSAMIFAPPHRQNPEHTALQTPRTHQHSGYTTPHHDMKYTTTPKHTHPPLLHTMHTRHTYQNLRTHHNTETHTQTQATHEAHHTKPHTKAHHTIAVHSLHTPQTYRRILTLRMSSTTCSYHLLSRSDPSTQTFFICCIATWHDQIESNRIESGRVAHAKPQESKRKH